MPVQINKIFDLVALKDEIVDHFLDGSKDGVEELVETLCPFPINVRASNVTARITVYNAIYVDHWDYLKNILF